MRLQYTTFVLLLSLLPFLVNAQTKRKTQLLSLESVELVYQDEDCHEGNLLTARVLCHFDNGDATFIGSHENKLRMSDFEFSVIEGGFLQRKTRNLLFIQIQKRVQEDLAVQVIQKYRQKEYKSERLDLAVAKFEGFELRYNEMDVFPGNDFACTVVGILDNGLTVSLGRNNLLSAHDLGIRTTRAGRNIRQNRHSVRMFAAFNCIKDPVIEVELTYGNRFQDVIEIPVHFNVSYGLHYDGRGGVDGFEDYCRRAADGIDGRARFFNGGHGENGGNGQNGFHGGDGGRGINADDVDVYLEGMIALGETDTEVMHVRIVSRRTGRVEHRYYNPTGGNLTIFARGGHGGNGGDGQDGGHGGCGGKGSYYKVKQIVEPQGEDQPDKITQIVVSEDAYGGHGGDGGFGGRGGNGGQGGDGGNVYIFFNDDTKQYLNTIIVDNRGGTGGIAGNGGCRGRSGAGAAGGRGRGTDGRRGGIAPDGFRGGFGQEGRVLTQQILQ